MTTDRRSLLLQVKLIGVENGKRFKNTAGVICHEEHIRHRNGRLIVKRLSNFTWWDKEVKAPPT
jgi:predicted solute-binding protein